MASKFRAKDIMSLIIRVLHNKERIGQVLDYVDVDELEAGTLGLHQDLLNRTFKRELMNRALMEDYEVAFAGRAIIVTADKFIKVMMLEKVLKFKITFTDLELTFGEPGHYFFSKYNLDISGIPAILEKMPGGSSIKDTIIASLLKNGIKDIPWIQLVNDRVYVDFSKVPGFDKLRDEGIYGIDVISTLELGNLESKNGKLRLTYKWVE